MFNALYEELTPIAMFTASLKKTLQAKCGFPLRVGTVRMVGPNPWIGIRVANWDGAKPQNEIPNEIRKLAVKAAYGDNANVGDWSNVAYGNITAGNISLLKQQWEQVLQQLGD